ncbi:probable purine permease 11 [Tanacetum coccineum]
MIDNEDPVVVKDRSQSGLLPLAKLKRWQWWLLVSINICFLIIGQIVAVLLGRFYYDQGGKSTWMATLVQTIGFPILLIPYVLLPSSKESSNTLTITYSLPIIFLVYIVIGVLIAGDNMLYSVGLLYLSASTYSLICATQLAFNAVWSYKREIVLGFVATLGASALYALLLSLMQLTFQKVIKKETFSVVLELQIYTSFIATCVSTIGLFASGEWKTLGGEMNGFGKGGLAYVMTLAWTAVAWQVCSVGVVGLIFAVSSLFSNVISTLSLALTPLAAVAVLHDKMNGVKIIAMLLGFWGFCTYIYQNYLDDAEDKRKQTDANGAVLSEASTPVLLE